MEAAVAGDYVNTRTRLKRVVHRHGALSRSGLQERLFTLLFSGLVYPQIWEDPEIDLEAMALTPDCHIVTIASGGCNVLSYLTAGPRRISAVDLNGAHVALNHLKLAGAAHLPRHEDFRRFFADANCVENVALYWRHLSANLDSTTRAYWEKRSFTGRRRIGLFARNFYRYGLLGRFIGAAHLGARAYGVDFTRLLTAKTVAEQRAFFDAEIAPVFDSKLTRWITSQPAALFGLGIPPSQFTALASGRPMHAVLRERVERLICDFPMGENYFAWQAFGRRYEPTSAASLPRYLQPQHFDTLKTSTDRVTVQNRSVTELLRGEPDHSVDRFVFLDAQDWMTNAQLNSLWTEVQRTARPEARVIFRTAGVESLLPGRIDAHILQRWHYHEADSRAWTARDRASIYGGFHMYSLAPV